MQPLCQQASVVLTSDIGKKTDRVLEQVLLVLPSPYETQEPPIAHLTKLARSDAHTQRKIPLLNTFLGGKYI